MRKLLLLSIAMLLVSCAQLPQKGEGGPARLSNAEAQERYRQGLDDYRDGHFDVALDNLAAAMASGRLKPADAVNTRKHMAFIYCVTNREPQCREQFQSILEIDPAFDLAPNETSQPAWGPVWRSIKSAFEEKRVIARAGADTASPAQRRLAEGMREYAAGHYKEAPDALENALKMGLPIRADEILARKYAAFAYCLTHRALLCRNEFHAIFALDPSFELSPSEVDHPAWAEIYRKEQTAARAARK